MKELYEKQRQEQEEKLNEQIKQSDAEAEEARKQMQLKAEAEKKQFTPTPIRNELGEDTGATVVSERPRRGTKRPAAAEATVDINQAASDAKDPSEAMDNDPEEASTENQASEQAANSEVEEKEEE